MGDWVLILTCVAVGFVLGACWMNARCRHISNRRAVQIENYLDRRRADVKALTPTGPSRRATGGEINSRFLGDPASRGGSC